MHLRVNFQNEVKQWITDNGGTGVIDVPTKVRVDKNKILEKLKSGDTIDQINCN